MNNCKTYVTRGTLLFLMATAFAIVCEGKQPRKDNPLFDSKTIGTGNPYLPLWEHMPDGEPRVFEDPDNPGKYRVYVLGSHDTHATTYCGLDIRMWSAPVEDLADWRDEGAIFTYKVQGKWDTMFAPDLVEVKGRDGKKVYYLLPHSRGKGREAMVCKGDRPDGPFTPINLSEDGTRTLPGSLFGFDPAAYIEYVTDPSDPDYALGFRAYGYWGFQKSSAAQLDPNTMYSARLGTKVIPYFLPAGKTYGEICDPEGTTYPALHEDQRPEEFNFFEASSIRKVGNKYVVIYSGYSGPEYGLWSSNSTLRYAYGDTPLGPWKIGGVLVDSRGIVPNKDGNGLQTTNGGHNTHGSIQEINGQWYVFYHRPPRNAGYARQPMVAPVSVKWDEKPVSEGGKVVIRGYDPYAEDCIWEAKASNGNTYTGAEVTSEGFHIYGLNPYKYYSAGYACYMSNVRAMRDSWDIWDNNMRVNVKNNDIVGFKYFGFGGLDKAEKGLKPFAGSNVYDKTYFNLFLNPIAQTEFKISIWLDGPWDNDVWKGKKIGEIAIPADAARDQVAKFTLDVTDAVKGLDRKHSIFLVAEGSDSGRLCSLYGLGFSTDEKSMQYMAPPSVSIKVDGKEVVLSDKPVRATADNGYTGYDQYEADFKLPRGINKVPKLTAFSDNPKVKINIAQPKSKKDKAVVKFDYKGVVKTYTIYLKEAE